MTNSITCPSCKTENELNETMRSQLTAKIRSEMEADVVVEAFITMQADLDSEKRSSLRIWSKRERQLQRALNNTASLYGDLQGIIGASMPVIAGLEMPRWDYQASDDPANTPERLGTGSV